MSNFISPRPCLPSPLPSLTALLPLAAQPFTIPYSSLAPGRPTLYHPLQLSCPWPPNPLPSLTALLPLAAQPFTIPYSSLAPGRPTLYHPLQLSCPWPPNPLPSLTALLPLAAQPFNLPSFTALLPLAAQPFTSPYSSLVPGSSAIYHPLQFSCPLLLSPLPSQKALLSLAACHSFPLHPVLLVKQT